MHAMLPRHCSKGIGQSGSLARGAVTGAIVRCCGHRRGVSRRSTGLGRKCLTASSPQGPPPQRESAARLFRRGFRPGSQTNRSELKRSLWLTESPEPRGVGAFAFSASVYAGFHTSEVSVSALSRDGRERRVTDPTRPAGQTSQTLSPARPKWFTAESHPGSQT